MEKNVLPGQVPGSATRPNSVNSQTRDLRRGPRFGDQAAEREPASAQTDWVLGELGDRHLREIVKMYGKPYNRNQEGLIADRKLLLRVLREHEEGWRLLRYASLDIRRDRSIILLALKGPGQGYRALRYAAPELRRDPTLVKEAMRKGGAGLLYADEECTENKDYMLEALRKDHSALQTTRNAWDGTIQANIGDVRRAGKKAEEVLEEQMWSSALGEKLGHEVTEAKSTFIATEDGQELRVVPLVALDLRRNDGLVLAQLAQWTDNTLKPGVKLPGMKIAAGEWPRDALARFIGRELSCLSAGLKVGKFDVEVEDKESERFKVMSRYLRAVFRSSLSDGFNWLDALCPVSRTKDPAAASTIGRRFCNSTVKVPPEIYAPNQGEDNGHLYAWLPIWEYEWARSSEMGRSTVVEWLNALDHAQLLQRKKKETLDEIRLGPVNLNFGVASPASSASGASARRKMNRPVLHRANCRRSLRSVNFFRLCSNLSTAEGDGEED